MNHGNRIAGEVRLRFRDRDRGWRHPKDLPDEELPDSLRFPMLLQGMPGHGHRKPLRQAAGVSSLRRDGYRSLRYDQPELIGTKGNLTEAFCAMQDELGRNLVLTDGLYRCPKCGGMSLRFVATTLFD